MKKISVIIPTYNEEDVIEECYKQLSKNMNELDPKSYDYELIFVNDGSLDKSLEILKKISETDLKAKVISFSRNFGHESANMCGLKYSTGDAIVIIDADLQDPPEIIAEMIKQWENGYDVVYGKRRVRKGESHFKKFTSKVFYRFLNSLSDTNIPNDTGDFRLIDRKVVNSVLNMPENNKYLRGLISWCGYKQYALEYDRNPRYAGKTKYSIKKLIKLAIDGIISFSSKPLKMVGSLGAFSIICSVLLVIYALVSYFTGRAIESGWTSLMITITFFTGIQLICLWVIAEYIARIFDNTKNRPEYIIDETINF